MSGQEWSGRAVGRARALVARTLPTACGKCGKPVHPDPAGTAPGRSGWVVGHIKDRWSHPHLMWEPSNWRAEHRACSDKSGQAAVIEKARREGAASVQLTAFDADPFRSILPETGPSRQTPPLPVSLPATGAPIDTRPELAWSTEAMRAHPWTARFAEIPEDAAPPLYMSPVPADAVGSYAVEPCQLDACCGGLTALEWIEQAERKTLRWWQALAITRQLEHREDGSLCHETILESCPRRAGKSTRLRGVALWRMHHGLRLFGEVQSIVHTGNNLAICREIQRGAWPFVREAWGEDAITKANGKEVVESPNEDRWMVKAQDAVYGYDMTLALADECWAVKPDTITEGMEPAILERSSPQLHLTSTAHRRATSLMVSKIVTALTGVNDDDDLEDVDLLLIWAAPFGSDPSDPNVWRAASPHWSDHRARLIRKKYTKALAGEVDKQADDPDPMAGFVAQYLNVWPVHFEAEERGEPLTSEHDWNNLTEPTPETPPRHAAIESWFSAGVSLALAWNVDGRALVTVTDHPDLVDAVAWLKLSGHRGRVTVGASLVDDPALKGVRVVPGKGRTSAACGDLVRLLAEDALRHNGSEDLARQVLGVRTVDSLDGPRVVSTTRVDGIKAAVWAARAARAPGIGKPRILSAMPETSTA